MVDGRGYATKVFCLFPKIIRSITTWIYNLLIFICIYTYIDFLMHLWTQWLVITMGKKRRKFINLFHTKLKKKLNTTNQFSPVISRVFSNESVLHIRWPNTRDSASASILPMNIPDWFPLGLKNFACLIYFDILYLKKKNSQWVYWRKNLHFEENQHSDNTL